VLCCKANLNASLADQHDMTGKMAWTGTLTAKAGNPGRPNSRLNSP
jgi:hypothetical protein